MNISTKIVSAEKSTVITTITGEKYEYVASSSAIKERDGTSVFSKSDILVPPNWSQNAIDILVQKYFRKAGIPLDVITVAESDIFEEFHRSEAIYSEDSNTPTRGEFSAHEVFHRLAGCWTYWGIKAKYFKSKKDAVKFYNECYYSLYRQIAAPNSPQWFNTGLYWAYGISGDASKASLYHYDLDTKEIVKSERSYIRPQVHACFIQSINDSLINKGGIMDLFMREATIFKYGSGSGTNYSNLRGEGELLSGGGVSSGLMSFLKIGDTSAGAIKSGGTTRRAARMVSVNVDHPEIEKFIGWKASEENKVAALIAGSRFTKKAISKILDAPTSDDADFAAAEALDSGIAEGMINRALQARDAGTNFDLEEYDAHWEGEAYRTVSGQNANNTVAVTDAYINAVANDADWNLTARKDGKTMKVVKAKKLWDDICKAAWVSADPGLHFLDTMNEWNTVANDEPIKGSNPCCFVGETLVDTSEGRIPFAELEMMFRTGKKLPMAFAFDRKKQLPVLKQIRHVWVAGKTKKLIKVTTDKGVTLQCTPEHRFLLRNGEYVEAQHLQVGDSLRKIGRTDYGGRNAILSRQTENSKRGTAYQNRWMWEQAFGNIPDGYDVHHINEDKYDDRLSNFELILREDHKKLHSQGEMNHNYLHVDMKKLVETADAVIAGPHNKTKNPNPLTPSRWNKYIQNNNLVGIVPLAGANGRIRGMGWGDFLVSLTDARDLVNDKVQKIEFVKLDEAVKVYDMEVDGVHNFAVVDNLDPLVNPIVVHNSEYIFIDDTACNLSSLNLVALYREGKNDSDFAVNLAQYSRLWTTVLDISVEMAQFVSETIGKKTQMYRPLGLGYANLGSLIMRRGFAYGSTQGKELTASITAIMHGASYSQSAKIAKAIAPFPAFERNESSFMKVVNKHIEYAEQLPAGILGDTARSIWNTVSKETKFRNAFHTCLAPTGTIGLVMDCDTTGIEPDFALVKHKKLAGGGFMRIINNAVPEALNTLGYFSPEEIECVVEYISGARRFPSTDYSLNPSTGKKFSNQQILEYITTEDLLNFGVKMSTLENIDYNSYYDLFSILTYLEVTDGVDLSLLKIVDTKFYNTEVYIYGNNAVDKCELIHAEDKAVFKCAIASKPEYASISTEEHLQVMAEAQKFLSGAISKTINMPATATVEEISEVYFNAWTYGLKAVAIYRDGSKLSQPLMSSVATKLRKIIETIAPFQEAIPSQVEINQHVVNIIQEQGTRRRLPSKRRGYTQKVNVDGHNIYLRTGEYNDGKVGEIFLDMHKEGATFRAVMNCFAIAVSIGLQYGVPLEEFVEAFVGSRFEPAGPVRGHDNIKMTKSLLDCIFRDLAFNYLDRDDLVEVKPVKGNLIAEEIITTKESTITVTHTTNEVNFNQVETRSVASANYYTGDQCRNSKCGGFRMKRAGTCSTCEDCGETTGCS